MVTVYVGCYINKIEALDVNTQTVKIDAYLWFRWPICSYIKGNIIPNPNQTYSFPNGVDLWGFTSTITPPDCTSSPGFAYMNGRIEATFYQRMVFDTYPIDMHNILIILEDEDYDTSKIEYVPDPESALSYDTNSVLAGWHITDVFTITEDKIYQTNWGIPGKVDQSVYSRLTVGITIARPVSFYIAKILLPIGIVEFITFAGFWNSIVMTYDARMATASGSLLATIFLQLSFGDKLPLGVDLTLMDWIFNVAYIFILFVIIETILLKNLGKKLEDLEAFEFKNKQKQQKITKRESTDEEEIQHSESEDKSNTENTQPKQTENSASQELRTRIKKIDRISFTVTSILCPAIILYLSLYYYSQQLYLVEK